MDSDTAPKTLQEAVIRFADKPVAHDFFVRMRFPNGVACPRMGCGSADVAKIKDRNAWVLPRPRPPIHRQGRHDLGRADGWREVSSSSGSVPDSGAARVDHLREPLIIPNAARYCFPDCRRDSALDVGPLGKVGVTPKRDFSAV